MGQSIHAGGLTTMDEEHRLGSHPGQQVDWGGFLTDMDCRSLALFGDVAVCGMSRAEMEKLGSGLGFRILPGSALQGAQARLADLVGVDVALLACTGEEAGLGVMLARLDLMAETYGTKVIVVVGLAGLDMVCATMDSSDLTILCDPDLADLVATLAALQGSGRRSRLHDPGTHSNQNNFEQLSNQLDSLKRAIEALMVERFPDHLPQAAYSAPEAGLHSPDRPYAGMEEEQEIDAGPPVTSGQIRAILRIRRLRDDVVAGDLFADPAWDILLDLMAARLERTQVSVSSLCIAAAVPPTTALRWIRQLTERGLLERRADPDDGRRIFIALSDLGAGAVQRWFHQCKPHLIAALG